MDAASPQRDEQIAEVDKVLEEIGANEIPCILIYNKIDQAGYEPQVERNEKGEPARIFVSALQRTGLDGLRGAIAEFRPSIGNEVAIL